MHFKPLPTVFLLALGAGLLTTSGVVTAAVSVVVPAAGTATASQRVDVAEASITELGAAMARGEVTSAELVDAYLARIEAYDQQGPRLNAIIQVNPRAREEAAALDAEREAGEVRGPLHGVPIILKDNYDTADMPTTAGSVALAGYYPARDGFQVRRLRRAGAVILAKSNMHELAMGITTISSLGGQTRNPYDLARNPGGSSGGTGAAIAASFAAAGMGSDTCGSIRNPAAQNNLAGLRPTKGLSSISGIIPLSHTQDVGGPLARTVTDLAIVLDATIGADPDDAATRILDDFELASFTDALDSNALRGARLGKLTELFEGTAAQSQVIDVIDAALEHMKLQGAEIVDTTIPGLRDLIRKSGVINYEFKYDFIDYLAANPGAPVGSLAEIMERGLYHEALRRSFERRERMGTRDGDAYLAALEWRSILRDAVVQILDENRLDGLVYPTLTAAPSRIGEPQSGSNCSLSPNTGLPAVSVAAGFTSTLLPVGLEILGRPLSDTSLVSIAYAFEQSADHRVAPAVTPPLVNGAAPPAVRFETTIALDPASADAVTAAAAPLAHAAFIFDPTRNTLAWTLTISDLPADQLHGATLHTGNSGDNPAFARIAPMATDSSEGAIDLTPVQRRALETGQVWLRVFSRDDPQGTARARLTIPRR